MVGICRHTGDDIRITTLHSPGRTPQANHTAGTASRHVIQPTRAQAKMLGEAYGRIGEQAKRRSAKAIDIGRSKAGSLAQSGQSPRHPPVRRFHRIALIGNTHRSADDDSFISLSLMARELAYDAGLLFKLRRSVAAFDSSNLRARLLTSARLIFCDAVKGNSSTKAI